MKITLSELLNMHIPDHASIEYMPVFADPVDTQITLDYGSTREKYTIRLAPDDLSGFAEWIAKVAAK